MPGRSTIPRRTSTKPLPPPSPWRKPQNRKGNLTGWGEGAEDGEKADVTNEETALKRDAEEREVGTGQKAKRGKK